MIHYTGFHRCSTLDQMCCGQASVMLCLTRLPPRKTERNGVLQQFYAGCPSWHNPSSLPGLGTGTEAVLSLSPRFHGRFPGEPRLAGVFWSKGWWRWWWQLDYWSYKSCKASVKSSPPTSRHRGCTGCMKYLLVDCCVFMSAGTRMSLHSHWWHGGGRIRCQFTVSDNSHQWLSRTWTTDSRTVAQRASTSDCLIFVTVLYGVKINLYIFV